MSKIENRIQKWLSDEGLFRQKVPDDNANFHFIINYPEDHVLDVVQPKGKDDMILIACATNVSPEHQTELKKLSNEKREEFMWDFRFLLNNHFVDFQLHHPENILQSFLITDEIFEDGLSKDRLISTVKKIFRAKLQGIWKIQMDFGVHEERSNSPHDNMYV
ncbi:DUF2299 domain-containing protein [Methanobacterium sp. ACI-7]|uniref:DUF2299 domain-containing protein n=1 Tax=unclassified Methanobacterium TaxID=2627676 RepID=UPI0039C029BA